MTMLKPGYKQTDLGVLPEEWDAVTFGDVMTGFSSGATPYRANKHYYNGNIKWVTSGELNYNVITETLEHISQEAVKRTNLRVLPRGTFLMAITGLEAAGTRGSCAILGTEATTNQSCLALFPGERLLTQYLYYYYVLHGDALAFRFCQGTKQQSYTGSIVKKLPLALPPISEQQVITDTLGAVDALLSEQQSLLTKKRDLKQATQTALLTRTQRLPGFSGEWHQKTLGEVATGFSSGATPYRANKHYYNGNIKWVTSGELNYNIITDTIEHISPLAVKRTNLSVLPIGTFLMAITGLEAAGTRGSCAILGTEATTNQSCMAVFPGKYLLNDYLFHYYVNYGDELAFRYCQGTKQQSYTGKIVKILPIYLPPIDEQRAIISVLNNMAAEIESIAAQISKTEALKQGLMQDLLTGTIRLTGAAKSSTV